MDENEKKKIEARIKRFGKVEANDENFKFDNYRNSLIGNFNKKDHRIENKEKKTEGSYLFIRKANFDQIDDSNLNLDKQQIFPIKTKMNEDKKKEVNQMSTDDIEDYFGKGRIKKLFWLNDYSCVVEFNNEEISLSLFENFTDSKIDINKSDIENFNWKPSKSYKIMEKEDILKKSSKKESKFYKFNNLRKKELLGNNRNRNKKERSRSRDIYLEEKELEKNI